MSQQAIDPQLIRDWVYQELKGSLQTNTSKLDQVLRSVYNQACGQKHLQPQMCGTQTSFSITSIPPDLQNSVRGIIWDLIIQGIIVPGVPNEHGGSSLSSFVVTEWGKQCLERQEYLTFDEARYIESIRASIPKLDKDAILYLRDSLRSFRVGAFLS